MVQRSLSFGSVAPEYERFRLGYPDELVDRVLAYAGRSIGTALEIGAGTGLATRVFAARGIAVTASEPDPEMLAELIKHVPAVVATVPSSFEELPLTASYDLVFAAASLHWTVATGRWPRVAALLDPRGVFASIGGPLSLADPALDEAVRAARSEFLEQDDIPSPDGTPADSSWQWPGTELKRNERFVDVRQTTIERRLSVPARQYLGYLSTVSAYLGLPAATRAEVFARIRAVLPAQVDVQADLTLHLARKA